MFKSLNRTTAFIDNVKNTRETIYRQKGGADSISDQRVRPRGVTVIGAIMLLSGAIWLIIGLALITMWGIALIQAQPISGSDAILGPVLFLWGFFNFEIAFGLFGMKERAWILAVVSTLIGLIFIAAETDILIPVGWGYPLSYQLKGAFLAFGVFQLLYLFFSRGSFRKEDSTD